ncbi:protein IMPACT-B-like [Amyelois transitella]|uniref:protein IMPACT-B-like n=1 Tax=Amyelois transitella TaxID=680683 RepID=UPI00298FDFB5|nr:protein IMPACT-B-like [Amyelois transitella]
MWAWMSAAGPGELVYLPERVTAINYLEVLQETMLPTVRLVYPESEVPDILFITPEAEEIGALASIYGDDWNVESDSARSFCVRIAENKREVLLYVTMPPNYPDQASAKYELSAPWMDRKSKEALHEALDQVSLKNAGGATIYQWAEKIREIVRVRERKSEKRTTTKKPTKCNGGDAALHPP